MTHKDDYGIIVTGNEKGEVKFYDNQLKLLYWCHRLNVDSVRGLSFHLETKKYTIINPKCNMFYFNCSVCMERVMDESGAREICQDSGRSFCACCSEYLKNGDPSNDTEKLLKYKTPADATPKDETLTFRDFIIQTDNHGIAYANFVHERYTTILDYRKHVANAIAVHPEKSLYCIGFADGTLESINFITHRILSHTDLRDKFKVVIPPKDDSINSAFDIKIPQLSVRCLEYSPSGAHLACGLNNGQLLFLDPVSIQISTDVHHNAYNAISMMSFSCDSLMLVLADIDNTVCLYKYNCATLTWIFVGKKRSHFKDITSIIFTSRKTEDTYRLFSFGVDKHMIEYGIGEGSFDILRSCKIDLTAVTLSSIEWPTPPNVETDFPAILITDDEYKYKIINCDKGINMGTYLGPRFEQPVDKMILRDDGNYLLFATKTTIGLQKLPLDGNPYKHIALLCHPKKIISMRLRNDINKLFILGENDNCILEWEPNYSSVDKTTELGGPNLFPYYPIIEGGKNGWLFHEMRDLFYYIQLLYQGTYLSTTRTVGDHIPIESLPDIMRALGFFPSEFSIENMLYHAQYNVYNSQPDEEIDFENFVKLYLNHRPAFGENMKVIKNAFKAFATMRRGSLILSREDFVQMLCEKGEQYSLTQAWYLLSTLCGHLIDDRNTMIEDFSFLPEDITFSDFMQNILGIPESEFLSEQASCLSMGSQQASNLSSDD